MAKIVFDNIWKVFGESIAMGDLNLEIEDGEFLVFVGPSGCGKTTTLRMLAGLETPSHGRILIDGKDVTLLPPGRRDIAMVFQSYALYAHLSVYKNLTFGPEVRGESKAELKERVEKVARLVGLEKLLNRRPGELSGGQRQRVALGRALIREPRLFLMDEPLSNLDAGLRTQMRVEIVELQRRLGITTVYVTHDQVEAMTMGHRIAVFNHGKLLQVDTPQNLYRNPVNQFVATFIGSPRMNIFESNVSRQMNRTYINTLGITIPVEDGVNVMDTSTLPPSINVGIRPSDIYWTKDAPSRCVERTSGNVKAIETTGSESFVLVDIGGQIVNCCFPSFASIQIGQQVDLVFDPRDLYFFDVASGKSLSGLHIAQTPTITESGRAVA
ncbi:ABC transporter ATP-binding protein [Paraburkholderia sp. EG285A]|uniref:ABC transporter ATP-binding protein n=1 Tax=Paraburkholderia sp. EG285A TaxID=3237009 RepID=UPI0034D3442D